jgi:hypothetical protein
MTLDFAAKGESECSKGILLSPEENVLLTVRQLVASLRRKGSGVTIESLEHVAMSVGAVRTNSAEQSGRKSIKLQGVEFRFQHSKAPSNGIEICFISDQC